jgi:hypothetical protein
MDEYLRITVISPTGVVLADSLSETTENHLDRPEIQHPGTGFLRHSRDVESGNAVFGHTIGFRNLFTSRDPLRKHSPLYECIHRGFIPNRHSHRGVFGFRLPFYCQTMLVPLQNTVQNLKEVHEGRYVERLPLEKDEEMNRIINEINAISQMISRTIQSLNIEKRKRDFILDHMDQGLCVLDSRGRIVMINRFAASLLNLIWNKRKRTISSCSGICGFKH